ncbi:MAG: LPS-assembly protein LptD [Bdellovibrionia bacterium]
MPLPKRVISSFWWWISFKRAANPPGLIGLGLFFAQTALAIGGKEAIHFSADQQIWDRKTNQVELIGHAAVTQPGETLTADYIKLNLEDRILDAQGHCIYIMGQSSIYGHQMHFNLETHTGTVIKGRVSNESFTLRGEKITQVGPRHYLAEQSSYTTCHDCEASWSFESQKIDLEFEGYGYLSNVTGRIKNTPAFWFPYLIIPLKTKRQTGFLFPSISASGNNGATFVLPFFWAISRSADLTLGLGEYSARGTRVESETRYQLSARSGGVVRMFYLNDRKNESLRNRWGVDIAETQELPWGIDQKLKLTEVSDNLYPFMFPSDVPGAGEAFQSSYLAFSKSSPDFSGYLSFQRYRNLLNSTPADPLAQRNGFDSRTVQALPSAFLTTNDRFLLGTPLVGGLSVGFTHFTRQAGWYDLDRDRLGLPLGAPLPSHPPDFLPGVDPIRSATRVSITPSVYATLRPWDRFSLVPSLQYRGFFYNFAGSVPNLNRGYLLFQTDFSTQLERIFEFPDSPDTPRAKHLIRPFLTYSFIPLILETPSNHPFLEQMKSAQKQNKLGYNFDNHDIVPVTYSASNANYFIPLGNSLSYGFTTQWVRRKGKLELPQASYQRSIEWSTGQSLNFMELTQPVNQNKPNPFSRLFSGLLLNFDRFTSQTTYYYYPDIDDVSARSMITSRLSYVMDRAVHQRVLNFDRSFNLSYSYFKQVNAPTSNLTASMNFSLNDYVLPTLEFSYNFVTRQLLGGRLNLSLQSPSRCWVFSTSVGYISGLPGLNFSFNWALNLTGSGFSGV